MDSVFQVAVSMQDGGKLSPLSLSSGKMEVVTTLVLHNGTEVDLGGEEKTQEPALALWKHSSSIRAEVRRRPGQYRAVDIRGVVLTARYRDAAFQGEGRLYLARGERKHRLHLSCSTRRPKVRTIISKEEILRLFCRSVRTLCSMSGLTSMSMVSTTS